MPPDPVPPYPGPPDPEPGRPDAAGHASGSAHVRMAVNRRRQRELYGSPLGDRVRRLTTALDITQARLARTLGLSPAMLSQLASARRIKIGDPGVLARLQLLDRCCTAAPPGSPAAVDALLEEVARVRPQWPTAVPPPRPRAVRPAPRARRPEASAPRPPDPPAPAEVLRALASPARLAAAAATLAPAFPELAEALRQAAGHPAPAPEPPGHGPRRASRRPW